MPLTPSTSSPRQRAATGTAGERESPTPSQLDILAERNERFASPSPLRRAVLVIAIVGVALLLCAVLWWVAQRADPDAPGTAPKANAASATTGAIAPAVAPDPAASRPLGTSTDAQATDALTAAVAVPAAAPPAVPAQTQASAPTPAERARKAQARRDADARAKASPAPAQRQQRDIDKARDLTEATPAAAETRSGAGPAASGAETAPRPRAEGAAPGVRELCATRNNIVSQLFCHSRECRKAERATDATCVRLKEIEDAQRRVDQQ